MVIRAVRPVYRTGFQPVQEKPVCEPVWQKLIIFNLTCFSKKTGLMANRFTLSRLTDFFFILKISFGTFLQKTG
jgi:hypothetical protein